ncbi:MAG TPA: hypothetical protein PK993_05325 [Clostridia bacterium]|nr:hypothetical protein [Clostridia bacterium]
MIDLKYANAYSEVLEILKYISKEQYNKIPNELIKVYEENSDKNYYFKYNPEKTLEEQKVLKITKIIIAILFRDYWATDEQKAKIIANQNNNRKKLENKKIEKYNAEEVFKKNEIIKEEIKEESLILIKKEKWYLRIYLFLKNLIKN